MVLGSNSMNYSIHMVANCCWDKTRSDRLSNAWSTYDTSPSISNAPDAFMPHRTLPSPWLENLTFKATKIGFARGNWPIFFTFFICLKKQVLAACCGMRNLVLKKISLWGQDESCERLIWNRLILIWIGFPHPTVSVWITNHLIVTETTKLIPFNHSNLTFWTKLYIAQVTSWSKKCLNAMLVGWSCLCQESQCTSLKCEHQLIVWMLITNPTASHLRYIHIWSRPVRLSSLVEVGVWTMRSIVNWLTS